MKKKIISIPSAIPGCTEHYDSETGQLVGYSTPGLVSGVNEHFSADGADQGYSVDGLFGGRDHYDEDGGFAGFSTPGLFAGTDLFDTGGRHVGSSVPNLFSGSTFRGDDQKHLHIFLRRCLIRNNRKQWQSICQSRGRILRQLWGE